jgi:hypothetical protein
MDIVERGSLITASVAGVRSVVDNVVAKSG